MVKNNNLIHTLKLNVQRYWILFIYIVEFKRQWTVVKLHL